MSHDPQNPNPAPDPRAVAALDAFLDRLAALVVADLPASPCPCPPPPVTADPAPRPS